MSLQSQIVNRSEPLNEPRIAPDLRRHRRVPLSLNGRFMRESREEYPCVLQDISVGGAGVESKVAVNLNERIIAQFPELGGIEGQVSRLYRDGFALQFKISAHKREKLAAQIMWLINRDSFPDEANRAHERLGITGRSRLKLDEKIVIDVDVLDLSISGASLGTSARPPISTIVMLGPVQAIVRRHHETGIGLQFIEMQDLEQLKRMIF